MKKREIWKGLLIIINIINIVNLLRHPLPYRVGFDKLRAKEILEETYRPLMDFVKGEDLIDTGDLLLVPHNIRGKDDFIELFDGMISDRVLEGFYQNLVIEKEEGLYIDKKVYIPSILCAQNGKISKAYIRKEISLNPFKSNEDYREEGLVIRESWKISGEWRRRSNYFIKDENGEWVLDYFNGSSFYKFVNVEHNPWYNH